MWTTNHGREYRYYTCSQRIKTGYGKCKLPSLPAGEIETVVVDQLRALLRHPDVIARTYREIQDRADSEPSQEASERLTDFRQRRSQLQQSIGTVLSLGDRNGFMADELKRLNGELNALDRSIGQLDSHPVNIEPVELARVKGALGRIDPIWDVLHPEEQQRVLTVTGDADAVVVRIPVRFYRRNGRQMVLTQGGDAIQPAPEREANGTLLAALAKAHRWQEQLESGQYAGLEDLAAANGVDRTYVGRIRRLMSLSPGIVERILTGDEPEGISLAKLRTNLPVVWKEQGWG